MDHDNLKLGRIMIVDDEAELMTALCEALAGQGYETTGFTTGADASKVLVEQDYDLLLTDLMMPEMDGIALLQAGLEIDPNLVCIIMTGHGTVQTAVEAMKKGAFDYILKPFKLNTLMPVLSRAMEVRSLRMDNIQLKETVAIHELGKAIAFSTDLNAIMNKVADAVLQQCASDEVSIMLPTRDGKELYIAVARGGHSEYIGERVTMGRGIAGWVASNRETVIINGKVDDPRFSPVNPRTDIRAAVSMPMMAGGNLVGVLNVNVTKSHRHMTLGQVKALSILVSIISPILENTWLNIRMRQAEEKYRSIFENSTEGIYQTTPEGQFITANTAMATMLGYDSPEELISTVTDIAGQVYVNPEDQTKIRQIIENNGQAKSYETQFYRKDGSVTWVSMSTHAVCDKKGELLNYDGIVEDISERKRAERQQVLTSRILETLNRSNDIQKLIDDILHLLKESTGIEAVGIRLREGEDYPYYVTNGFSDHFVEAENYLCALDDAGEIIRDSKGNPYLECMCGNILCGRTDPSKPFFTEGGSFWTNSTTKHLAEKSEKEYQCRIRNRCNGEGYESVALIPLQSGSETIGLLQFNDSRRNLFTLDMIRFLEGIGASIGIVVTRRRSAKALQESEQRFMNVLYSSPDAVLLIDGETFYDCNEATVQMLGYSKRDEVLKTHPSELSPPTQPDGKSSFEKANEMMRTAFESGFHRFEWAHRRANGEEFPVEVSLTSIVLHGKNMLYCTWRDLTEQKRAEEWLLRERSMVDRIMKTSPAGITVVDRKGQIVFANKRAEEIFCLTKNKITQRGYSASEWHITDFDGNPFPEEQLPFTQVMNAGNPVYGVRHAIELSGRQRVFLSINGAPIFDESGHISEVVFTIDDITQYRQAEEKIIQSIKLLEKSMEDTIKAMSMVVETRDPYTAGHQGKVARLAVVIAEKLNLSELLIKGILMAGVIHDIGKIYIPAEFLSKPGKLSETEMAFVRTHSQKGYDIMKNIAFPWPVARVILEHHERIDGSGYPDGKFNNDILLESRIIAVADVVEAIASHRPYRPALGIDAALGEIEKNKGVLYDSDVVDACLMLFREEGFQLEGT
ncbi:MAG: PAS domain S-box protein [Desulfobacterales bacterium]|nr:PAS domain S-box protein [Desulfobacterales bacterium]